MSAAPLQVGDPVVYAAAFLRSINVYSGPMTTKRGVITKITKVGSWNVAMVDWGDARGEAPASVGNLWHAERLHLEPS